VARDDSAGLGSRRGRVASCVAVFQSALQRVSEAQWNLRQVDGNLSRCLRRGAAGLYLRNLTT
jgi:hypothetical protein